METTACQASLHRRRRAHLPASLSSVSGVHPQQQAGEDSHHPKTLYRPRPRHPNSAWNSAPSCPIIRNVWRPWSEKLLQLTNILSCFSFFLFYYQSIASVILAIAPQGEVIANAISMAPPSGAQGQSPDKDELWRCRLIARKEI